MNMNWRDNAACVGQDISMFFDENPKTMRQSSMEAKKFCDSCKVRKACFDFAVDNNVFVGIYGGMSNKQRRFMKKASGEKLVPGRKTGWNK
jgi:WhiB family redox-sensing transcriptional regulator